MSEISSSWALVLKLNKNINANISQNKIGWHIFVLFHIISNSTGSNTFLFYYVLYLKFYSSHNLIFILLQTPSPPLTKNSCTACSIKEINHQLWGKCTAPPQKKILQVKRLTKKLESIPQWTFAGPSIIICLNDLPKTYIYGRELSFFKIVHLKEDY